MHSFFHAYACIIIHVNAYVFMHEYSFERIIMQREKSVDWKIVGRFGLKKFGSVIYTIRGIRGYARYARSAG